MKKVNFTNNLALYVHHARIERMSIVFGTLYRLKACQVHDRSHEITNESCICTTKSQTKKLWLPTSQTGMNASDVEKIKNRCKQNFEDEANDNQLDKEATRRRNLNIKYLSLTLVVKHPDAFICFYCVQ